MAADDLKINKLPGCWICNVRFLDCGGTANREEHHIVPVKAGGIDGPQVSLCDSHHTKVHRIEEKLAASKPHFMFLQDEDFESKKKLMWLATTARNSFAATDNDPNKKKIAQVTVSAARDVMINRLKKVYPGARSREAIYNIALESLYRSHFTE